MPTNADCMPTNADCMPTNADCMPTNADCMPTNADCVAPIAARSPLTRAAGCPVQVGLILMGISGVISFASVSIFLLFVFNEMIGFFFDWTQLMREMFFPKPPEEEAEDDTEEEEQGGLEVKADDEEEEAQGDE